MSESYGVLMREVLRRELRRKSGKKLLSDAVLDAQIEAVLAGREPAGSVDEPAGGRGRHKRTRRDRLMLQAQFDALCDAVLDAHPGYEDVVHVLSSYDDGLLRADEALELIREEMGLNCPALPDSSGYGFDELYPGDFDLPDEDTETLPLTQDNLISLIAKNNPRQRTVQLDLTVRYMGESWDASRVPDVNVGDRLWICANPDRADSVLALAERARDRSNVIRLTQA